MRNPFTRRNLLLTAALALLAACDAPRTAVEVEVIPQPQFITPARGTLLLPSPLTFSASMSQQDLADLLAYLPAYPLPLQQGGDDAFLVDVFSLLLFRFLLPKQVHTVFISSVSILCLDCKYTGTWLHRCCSSGLCFLERQLQQFSKDSS